MLLENNIEALKAFFNTLIRVVPDSEDLPKFGRFVGKDNIQFLETESKKLT